MPLVLLRSPGCLLLVIWLTWVMLDFEHMQSGFTLPQSVY